MPRDIASALGPWVRVYDPRTMDALDAGRALGDYRDSSFLVRLKVLRTSHQWCELQQAPLDF